ncbi:serine hydrolase [Microbacterium sp. GXF7504]
MGHRWGAVAVVCALGIVIAGCAGAEPERYAAPASNPNEDAVVQVTAEQVRRAVEDLPASVDEAIAQTGVPGVAVAVVHEGETIFAEGFGVRDVDSGAAVDADTVFPLASVSKSIGATVVARAIDEGLVTWDTPVVDNLPGFALSDPWATAHVTIGDMYAHRSGLYEHAGDDLEDLGYDRATILERLRYVPLAPFRTTYAYANYDITAAAESVARAAGTSWEELSERLLYAPLGMTSTSSRFVDLTERGNRALGHVPTAGGWIVSPQQRQPDAQAPAGGVSSSVTDLAAWMRMVLDPGDFLTDDALVPAISAQIPTTVPVSAAARGSFYGYGYNVSADPGGLVDVNHSGAFLLGAGTTFTLLPGADLGIVVLTNGRANGVAEAVAHRFTDIAQFGAVRGDWLTLYGEAMAAVNAPAGDLAGADVPADPAAPAELSSYTGDYVNEFYGTARVTLEDDGLVLRLGPTGVLPLEHWDGDVFAFQPPGENGGAGSRSSATFADGTLVLGVYDEHGLGTFLRTPTPR